MERSSTTQDVTQVLVSLLLSALLIGSVATQDVLSRDNITLGTHDGLTSSNSPIGTLHNVANDNITFDTIDTLSLDIITLDTLDGLSRGNSSLDTLDGLSRGNSSLGILDGLEQDNSSLGIIEVLSINNTTLATQDALLHDNSGLDTLEVFPILNNTLVTQDSLPHDVSTLAIMDALSQDNSTLDTYDVVPSDISPPATQDVTLHDTATFSSMTTVDPDSCDHLEPCYTGIVCGCYYHKRIDRLGRIDYKGEGCRKVIDCSRKNLTFDILKNINFSQFDERFVDIKMEGNELQVKDISILGEHIYNSTKTEKTVLYFGTLQNLPCPTWIHITRIWGIESWTTEVFCNNRNLTDRHIEEIVFPPGTKKLNLEHNMLTMRGRLEVKINSLQHLEQLDLSFNKLTAIPRLNISQKIGNFFSLNVDNNEIRAYDSATFEQYAPTEDDIHISIENNPFVCNCEAYYTNEVIVKYGETNHGKYKCLMPDEINGKNKLRPLPTKEEKYWKTKCEGWEVDANGYLYLIFSWHNLLDFCLILANVFVIYIVYDLYMAIRESRLKRVDPNERRNSDKSTKSTRKDSNIVARKISKLSRRRSSQAEPVKAHAPRRPLLDVIVCKIKKGYDNINNFINTSVFAKKVQVLEEDHGSCHDEKEEKLLRESRIESMRNSLNLNYETKL